jgi:hypothetical protein
MAYTVEPGYVSRTIASAIGAYLPVKSSASTARGAVAAASLNDNLLGFVQGTVGTYGVAYAVQTRGVCKAIAAASLGPGALVAVGSSNGRLIPVAATPVPSLVRYAAGISEEGAADGNTFSVLLNPSQLG